MIGKYANAIDAYRLIRRGLVGDSNPRDVELLVGTDRGETSVYGDVVRTVCKKAGFTPRKLHEYTALEWHAIATYVATGIDPLGTIAVEGERERIPHVPWYPDGWRESYAKVRPTKRTLALSPAPEAATP